MTITTKKIGESIEQPTKPGIHNNQKQNDGFGFHSFG